LAIKLIMTWDISSDQEQDYFEFVVREFIPGVQRLGFDLSDAWATVYGGSPQIMVGAVLPDAREARQVMKSEEWRDLHMHLQEYVKNYSQKMVEARGGFQF
jgi:hypothetical protein